MGKNLDILRLYKAMMRESQKFSSYNIRNYALRRVRDGFKESKGLENLEDIQQRVDFAESSYNLIKRQVVVGNMYQTHKLVIENANESSPGR